jgi:hypothetical protein
MIADTLEKHGLTMRLIALVSILALGVAGCSKKDEAGTEVTQEVPAPAPETPAEAPAENADAAAAAAPAPAPDASATEAAVVLDNAQMSEDLNAIPGALDQANYDTAVENLAALGAAPKSDVQDQAYREQLQRTIEYLRQKAETDAAARAAYQKLGRATMGR